MRKLTVRIKRYDHERDESPRWETYRVEADPSDRVLANRTVVDHLAAFTPRPGDAGDGSDDTGAARATLPF